MVKGEDGPAPRTEAKSFGAIIVMEFVNTRVGQTLVSWFEKWLFALEKTAMWQTGKDARWQLGLMISINFCLLVWV